MAYTGQFKRSGKLRNILGNNARCIYCANTAAEDRLTIEHMPPRGIFKDKQRPRGFEFASCESCNQGTKAADAAASFFARIDRVGSPFAEERARESIKYVLAADSGAPGLIREVLGDERVSKAWAESPGGVLVEAMQTSSGPIAKALLDTFAAKLGMAMFFEHTEEPLPLSGGVHTMWFLNAGLSKESANYMLSILPVYGTLEMGRKSVEGQFEYRFNSDDKTIVAALSHFNTNLSILTIAMEEPGRVNLKHQAISSNLTRPGQLLERMPKRPPVIIMARDSELHEGLLLPEALLRHAKER